MFRWTTLVAILSLLTARAAGSESDGDYEWNKYQCNLPVQDRPAKNACFCGFLKDRVKAKGQQASASQQQQQQQQVMSSTCTDGYAGGYPCKDIDLQALVKLSTFESFEANDVWGWTDPTGAREFAIIGLTDGTGFVEITNPSSPIYLGKLPTATFSSSWRDIKTYQNYAYIVSEASGHGMQVFNLTRLLYIDGGTPVTFPSDVNYNEFGSSHNVVINEDTGYAYAVGSDVCSGGLHMIDISMPTNPTFAGCYDGDGYVHDAHCVVYQGSDAGYQDNEICFCSNEDTVTIVDVTNKASPVLLSRTSYGSTGYTHQGWLSEDHNYFLFGDETDERGFGINTKTLVMKVTDLMNPALAGAYFGPTPAIDHNLYNVGNFTFLSNYRAGLRVLRNEDLSIALFAEIGYFDVYPDSDSNSFNGAWSVYPFFASGNIIVSDIEQGLFILKPDLTALPVCNNNGVCDTGEDCNNCSNDCGSRRTGNPNRQYCCDGQLPDCGNSACECAASPPVPGPTPGPITCGGNKATCTIPDDCCSNNCGNNGRCRGGRRLRLGGLNSPLQAPSFPRN